MTRLFTILATLLLPLVWLNFGAIKDAFGEERDLKVRALSDHGEIVLSDNRRVCLEGIWLYGLEQVAHRAEASRQTLLNAILGQAIRIDHDAVATFDRYGCQIGPFPTRHDFTLQEKLLRMGLAIVRPDKSLTATHIDHWLALENDARKAKLGVWRDSASMPLKADAANEHIGQLSLVEGKVVRTSSNDRYLYLNFGKDWRTDFTVRVRQKLIRETGLEPDTYSGKTLRVRGFLQHSRGPLIDVYHLKQIEIIP